MGHKFFRLLITLLVDMKRDDDRLRVIGFAIAQERDRQGLTQFELAKMVGKSSHSYISRIECGKTSPNLPLLFDIADALNVEVRYFFTKF